MCPRLEEYLRRRYRLQRVEEQVQRNIVTNFFLTLSVSLNIEHVSPWDTANCYLDTGIRGSKIDVGPNPARLRFLRYLSTTRVPAGQTPIQTCRRYW